MLPVPISTIDELLKVGGKIAEIVTILLNRKATQEEQKRAQSALEEFNQLKELHELIADLLQDYNTKLSQAWIHNGVGALFPICTHGGFKRVERLYTLMRRGQISHQELVSFELLTLNLITESSKGANLISSHVKNHQFVVAFTLEKWLTLYETQSQVEQEVINRYYIVWDKERWKIDFNNVFEMYDASQQ